MYSDPMEVSTKMITRCSAQYSGTIKVCAAHVHCADAVRALIRVQRRGEGHVEVLELDDEHGVDTAGTICKVYVFSTHGLFSGPAIERSNGLWFKKHGRVLTATHGRRRAAARSVG